ncbi:hypothetical protein [Pedobacter agri]|uniref:hypothetical protein n=1 Tax=Pedobacter agri TaxID=454586 RepID=UPI0027836FE8|nr:hypothetical protein [Pedobacter agri]MDQ1139530.1 hypothetical protein [Pedobacter agri]
MKFGYRLLILVITLAALGCNNANNDKQKELELKEKELALKEKDLELRTVESNQKKISLKDVVKLAEAQFAKYLPTMLNAHNAYLDSQDTFTGDFTGDGLEDIAIYFSLAPNEGGNTIVAQGLTLYKNTGTAVNVIAGYEPDYMFSFLKINKGKIYVKKLAYAETDGGCCPSIKTTHALTIAGSKVY